MRDREHSSAPRPTQGSSRAVRTVVKRPVMPSIGSLHPVLVHFSIALLAVGVLLRLVGLTGKVAFAKPAASLLIIAGVLAALASAKSGIDAHGPVERTPGALEALGRHQRLGLLTRNIFLGVGVMEIAALVLEWRMKKRGEPDARAKRIVLAPYLLSAVVGLVGLVYLFQTGRNGGKLVYSYAGGVGVRTGDPKDVGRLLIAGLVHQAEVDRKEGRRAEAGALYELAAKRFPDEPEVQLAAAESLFLDKLDPAAAIARLDTLDLPKQNRGLLLRKMMVRMEALGALGKSEEAAEQRKDLLKEFPGAQRVLQRREEMRRRDQERERKKP